ncbi:DUF2000 family protein [Marinomonas agarivorans]|nr:DUF2000 family protein [Marinomonas agarivorans]
MKLDTKVIIIVADDLAIWQRLNIVSFITSGIIAQNQNMIGEIYRDKSGHQYTPLSIQPAIILKAPRDKLKTILQRTQNRSVRAAIYIEDMFATGHDEANRATVQNYITEELPLVGIGFRAECKIADKITKGAKLHD